MTDRLELCILELPKARRILAKDPNNKDEAQAKAFYTETGLAEGRKQGINQKQIEVVKEMLKKDFDIHVISEITKVSIEEIKEIQSTLS